MLSKSRFAGAAALLLAPIVVIAATLVRPTLSDDAANQVAALTYHRGAMIAGIALSAIGVVLLTAGIVWLALALAPRAPSLAIAGGVLGVFGSLLVMFTTGVDATGAPRASRHRRSKPTHSPSAEHRNARQPSASAIVSDPCSRWIGMQQILTTNRQGG